MLTDAQRKGLEAYWDPHKRLRTLYKIVAKEEQDGSTVVTFQPNAIQLAIMDGLHLRNVVLKARQLGVSTLACILWLDTALFSADPMVCAIIAQDRDTAGRLFDKVTFAYDRLPKVLRDVFPVTKRTSEEIEFGHNGSVVRVATSARGGTINRLHISEMGKIGAKYPEKAKEIVTGSIPAVPASGIVIVESTAEGRSGRFYDMTMQALALQQKGAKLTARDYKLHFFAWWQNDEYQLDDDGVQLTPADIAYFHEVEGKIGRSLTLAQKRWYVATLRSADFAGERPLMWQEYPSFPEEPFRVSGEGAYYTTQLADARKQGRIRPALPVESGVPCNTFWDIGLNDNMAIWVHQRVGPENRFIRFYKNSGETLAHYVTWLLEQGLLYGTHFLPHDADAQRLGLNPDTNDSVKEMLEKLMPGHRFEIVPRVANRLAGIQATRQALSSCWFDETQCAEGLRDLEAYRKEWDERRGTWKDTPFHGPESDAADAFRQFGQVAQAGGRFADRVGVSRGAQRLRRRGSAFAR